MAFTVILLFYRFIAFHSSTETATKHAAWRKLFYTHNTGHWYCKCMSDRKGETVYIYLNLSSIF